jgi:hypothetical protein
MKRKLIYGTALALICYAYYLSNKNNQTLEKKIINNDFGIDSNEDIFTDTIDLRLYTSHGRLKYDIESSNSEIPNTHFK